MSFVEHFKKEYYDKLITPTNGNPARNRADSLLKVFELLEDFQIKMSGSGYSYKYTIIETGCIRKEHGDLNYAGDGCSTIIFNDFINRNDGTLYTIDISKENLIYASEKLSGMSLGSHIFLHGDSVSEINKLTDRASVMAVDLIYLDSFDVSRDDPHPSALHHLMELTAIMPLILPGTILVVDDSDAFFDGGKTGKATYVRQYMDKIGKMPIIDSYQLVYQF